MRLDPLAVKRRKFKISQFMLGLAFLSVGVLFRSHGEYVGAIILGGASVVLLGNVLWEIL